MENSLVTGTITVLTAIVGVAIIATLVSKNAQTSQILTSGGNAFGTALEAAVSPVTGSMPSISSFGGASPITIQ